MSDVKMCDVFSNETIENFGNILCAVGGDDLGTFNTARQAEYAAHAISTHDTMQARITELETALTNIKKHQETVIVGMPQLSATWQIASRALEK